MRTFHMISPQGFALIVWGMTLGVFMFLGKILFSFYGAGIGIITALLLIGYTIEYFLERVPKKTAVLVINPLLKNEDGEASIRTILSGWHMLYPWEQAKEDGSFSLEDIHIPVKEEFTAKDGPKVLAQGSIIIAPDPRGILQYFLSREIVQKITLDIIRTFISHLTASRKASTARTRTKEMGTRVTNYFSRGENASEEERSGTEVTTEIERQLGIVFKKVTVAIDYEDSYQKARSTQARTKILREAVKDIRKPSKEGEDPPLSSDEAWDNVLVIHGEAEKRIQKVEGKGGETLAALLMAMANAGNTKKEARKGGDKQ